MALVISLLLLEDRGVMNRNICSITDFVVLSAGIKTQTLKETITQSAPTHIQVSCKVHGYWINLRVPR